MLERTIVAVYCYCLYHLEQCWMAKKLHAMVVLCDNLEDIAHKLPLVVVFQSRSHVAAFSYVS